MKIIISSSAPKELIPIKDVLSNRVAVNIEIKSASVANRLNTGLDKTRRVTVECENLDGITFFDTLPKVEKIVRSNFKTAWNFAVRKIEGKTFNFSFVVDTKELIKKNILQGLPT